MIRACWPPWGQWHWTWPGCARCPRPGGRELVEALQACLAQDEPLGRGRAVARASSAVLVGERRGRLAVGTSRSALGPHVEALLAELRLLGPADARPVELRLDPLRFQLMGFRHLLDAG